MAAGVTLSADELALTLATRQAIEAAGGQEKCARKTVAGRTQLQRCASPNDRDSITIRDAAIVDATGVHVDGHPFILRAMADLQGFGIHALPEPRPDACDWLDYLGAIGGEVGEITGKMCKSLADGELCRRDIASTGLRHDGEQLLALAVSFLAALDGVEGRP